MSTSVTITSLARQYVEETVAIMDRLDLAQVEAVKRKRVEVRRRGGRVFITGSGGDGAGHASHAVDDFRKIAGIGAYSPSDNVSELTARINDESWDTSYAKWLEGSRLSPDDLIMVFAVDRHLRCAGQAGSRRQEPRRLVAGDGPDVLPRLRRAGRQRRRPAGRARPCLRVTR